MSLPDGAYLPFIKERSPSVDAERLRNSVVDWSAALAAISDLPSAVRQDVFDAVELAQRFLGYLDHTCAAIVGSLPRRFEARRIYPA
jgi:hypothetical protein